MSISDMIRKVNEISKTNTTVRRSFNDDIKQLHLETSKVYRARQANDTAALTDQLGNLHLRILDMAGRLGVDLETEYVMKTLQVGASSES